MTKSTICWLVALLSLWGGICQAQMGGMQRVTETVAVETVIEKKPILTKKYVAVFEPIEKVVSLARVSGDIVNISFKEGEIVEKGQLLFAIDDVRYQAILKQSEANISKLKAKIEYAQNNYQRNLELFASKAVSKDEVENLTSVLAGCNAELLAEEATQLLTLDDLKHTKIHSMIDGRIGRTSYTVGNYITPASGPLVTVVQIDPIYVRFSMSEKDFLSLYGNVEKLKAEGKLKLRLTNDEFFDEAGEITFVDNEIKTNTDTLHIWATFKNSKYQLNPGGIATLYLSKVENRMKPAVRLSAIMFDRAGHFVYLLDDKNAVVRKSVILGPADAAGEFQIIEKGVEPGDVIIVDGTHKAIPGTVVEPIPYQSGIAPKESEQKEAKQNTELTPAPLPSLEVSK